MQEKLQRKFVIFTTLIGTAVLLLITITINLVNYVGVTSYVDMLLNSLIDNNMVLNESFDIDNNFSQEIVYTTRFFVVTMEDGEVLLVDTKNISAVSAEEACELTARVMESGQDSGIIEIYKYIIVENDEQSVYIFLDIEKELSSILNYVVYSMVAVGVFVVLIIILSYLFSNKVVGVIVDGYERQKRFITNVSHEFKTPLAIIRADNDVIEIEHGEDEWTGSIKSQVQRLNNMVEILISLAKVEEEHNLQANKEFSLSETLMVVVDEFMPSLKCGNLEVEKDIENQIIYQGDEKLVQKLFEILLENAIKYAVAGTDIKVSLQTKGSKKVVLIENKCEKISIGKHNQWFERFYRGDESRNSEAKGFGIGLSIAKSICEKHGAKISASSLTGNEVIITIIF